MRYHRKSRNAFLGLVLATGFFALSVLTASAISVDNIPSADSIMRSIESRYHLDPQALQNQGEQMNVAKTKGLAPEVTLFFSPSDPKQGEKISAKAFPMYFSSTETVMYYTWYLKRQGCDLDDSPSAAKRARCNRDNNNRITVEDWKIEAMRTLAENGYDNSATDYAAVSGDSDGYKAKFGGDDKTDAPNHCFVHDNESGENHELVDGGDNSACKHLFPDAPGEETGDGSFGNNEEQFWGTDPQDPGTAGNGNKDEANVAGLGQSTFTWNYIAGDEVGVAVEGTSLFPTKYNNSSFMVMWAFPKNNCSPENTGTKSVTVSDFTFTIPTADMDLNSCIEKNLINPAEGGQATNLEVSVAATPDNPINDETSDKSGDIVTAQASTSNAQHDVTDMLFDWKVEISRDVQFGSFKDITSALHNAGLIGTTKGNALDSIQVKLDMPEGITSGYLNGGVGYLRFKVAVSENFSGDAVRKGKSDVIVKFNSTGKKISAYTAGTEVSSGKTKATLTGATPICNQNDPGSVALDRTMCRVIKNEIIGLKVDNASGGLSNFYWTVNGSPLTCSKNVSERDCSDTEQGNVNFFPVVGNPGDTYTVTVTANNVGAASTGADTALTLTRTFGVVAPEVMVESTDTNIAWSKLLGQYKDITGQATACSNGLCNDYSTSMFEALSGNTLGFRATFVPGFLASSAIKEWSLDGEPATESAPGELSFVADKPAGGIYDVGLTAQVKQPDDTRRALLDIWGISPFDSPEIVFSVSNQVQMMSSDTALGPESGPRKYLAAIVSYVPVSVMFTFRIFLSAVLVLFAASFLYALLGDRRAGNISSGISEKW